MRLINNRIIGGFDSITFATGDATVIARGAWRYHLQPLLKTWMRTTPKFFGRNLANGYVRTNNRMLGTTGRRTDQVLELDDPARTFAESKPGMLILLGPMNDATQIVSGAYVGGTVAISVSKRQELMDLYRAAVPEGIIVDCACTPNRNASNDAKIQELNAAQLAANDLRSDQAYIIECDLYNAIKADPNWDTNLMFDDTHENDAGQQVIANKIFEDIEANIQRPTRFPAQPRKLIKNKRWALRFSVAGTPAILGTSDVLDTSTPWAVNFEIDLSRQRSGNNGILCFKTDQSTPFIFLTFGNPNSRAFEFGSNLNFGRFFVNVSIHPAFGHRIYKGWHKFGIIYRGGGRTSSDNYDFVLDGIPIRLATAGSGLSGSTDQNAIGATVGGGATAGTFDICELDVFNGAQAMTVQQMIDWQLNGVMPSGVTMIRWYEFQQENGVGTDVIDSLGNQNGTIGNGTWVERGPTHTRELATPRALASPRASLS